MGRAGTAAGETVNGAAVLVPYGGDEPHRARNWAWVRDRYEAAGFEVVVGTTDVPLFSRTRALLDARARTTADVLVVADADVWCEEVGGLVAAVGRTGWAIPGYLHRLSAESTERVLAGEDWRHLPLSGDNRQDRRPYRVHPGGTLLAIRSTAFDLAPPDPRFVGWGQEDEALSDALHCLVGPPIRVDVPVVHLWHPPEPRRNRVVGNGANRALAARYRRVRRDPARMAALVEEGRAACPGPESNRRPTA